MTHKQISKLNMYQKMVLFFLSATNSAIWFDFERLVIEIARFVSLNNALPAYMQQQALNTTGITETKGNLFNTLVKLIVNKARKALVWACDTQNAELEKLFDIHKDDFIQIPESKAFTNIKNIRDAIHKNIDSMSEVRLTANDITVIDNAITAYQQTIGTPGMAKDQKKAATQNIENSIHPIDQSLELITNLITSEYSDSDDQTQSDMVKEFLNHKHIDKLPTHHSGISVHFSDADSDEDLHGVVMTVEGTGKTAASDIDGHSEIIKIKSNTYNVTFTLAGYETQTVKVAIIRGKIVELAIEMKKNALDAFVESTH